MGVAGGGAKRQGADSDLGPNRVFLSYAPGNRDFVEAIARRLQGDARLSFWFAPWHAVPGVPMQEQMELALSTAQACAIFIGGSGGDVGWQTEELRLAIQTRIENNPTYRVIPVFAPAAAHSDRRTLPLLLRRFLREGLEIQFRSPDDAEAFRRLLAGILSIPPIEVEGHIRAETLREALPPPTGAFCQGHALVIGIANYPHVRRLPPSALYDASDVARLLTDPACCGYLPDHVTLLLDDEATADGMRGALVGLSQHTGPSDTAVIYFSGHGAHEPLGARPLEAEEPSARSASSGPARSTRQYILPYDCNAADLAGSALGDDEVTELLAAIHAGRLLVLLDSCHSGGAGDPKAAAPTAPLGLSEDYYAQLAQGRGRVVVASARSDEASWILPHMRNSVFTHCLLEALRGRGATLGDGYVRVFDIFRHVASRVPALAQQHPIFKAAAMELDFPVALAPHARQTRSISR